MNPRRRIAVGESDLSVTPAPAGPRRWRLPLVTTIALVVVAGAVTVGTLMLVAHESHRRAALREVVVLDVARAFTAEFLSPDPTGDHGANRYVDRMTSQATGEFAQWWQDSGNDILIQIARGPQVSATVLAAGVERWNDDGSADVLVVATTRIKDAEGKTAAEPTVRVLETIKQEGDQWKISNLSPVM